MRRQRSASGTPPGLDSVIPSPPVYLPPSNPTLLLLPPLPPQSLSEEDRGLPFIKTMLPMLQAGVGVHHSGAPCRAAVMRGDIGARGCSLCVPVVLQGRCLMLWKQSACGRATCCCRRATDCVPACPPD